MFRGGKIVLAVAADDHQLSVIKYYGCMRASPRNQSRQSEPGILHRIVFFHARHCTSAIVASSKDDLAVSQNVGSEVKPATCHSGCG